MVVLANNVGDGEVGTPVVLRWGEEGFEDVWEEEGSGVFGGRRLDVVVEDGDWVWDCGGWALFVRGNVRTCRLMMAGGLQQDN